MSPSSPRSRRLSRGALLLAAVVVAGNLLAFELRRTQRVSGDVAGLAASPLVGRPTGTSVTVNLLAGDGPVSGEVIVTNGPSVPFHLDPGTAQDVTIGDLVPGRAER